MIAHPQRNEVHSDLQHLVRLQQLDSDIESARRRIADIPGIQQALDDRLAEQQTAVAAIKQRLADSQTARRDIEKEVASIQGRLSKFKDQLMEVKTNKEYQAMQNEIATAEERSARTRTASSSAWRRPTTLAADLKAAEAELKAPGGGVDAGTAERCTRRRPRSNVAPTDVRPARERRGARAVRSGAEAVRARRAAAQGAGRGRGA